MQNSKHDFYFFTTPVLVLFVVIVSMTGGCTTLDFHPPLENGDVYRIQIENLGDADVAYRPQLSLYYIDGKQNLNLPDGTILANDPVQLIAESEQGTYGVSVDVLLNPGDNTVQLSLERGSGTGDDFILDEVVESKTGSGAIFIRYGDYY